MILIYSHKLTPRVRHAFKTIFTDVLKVEIRFTDDVEEYENYENAKINYSTTKLASGIFFQSTSILLESGIKEQSINVFDVEGIKCFFNVGKESEFPFDPFAASFYLLSRYEEYLPHRKDIHERFLASESLAFQHHFLDTPLVNYWIEKIENCIISNYNDFQFPQRAFISQPTIDVDNAYAYKHKGTIRVCGGLIKSLFYDHSFRERLKVLRGKFRDPYDTFDYQLKIHKKYDIFPIYFFLLGNYGAYDKNISVKNKTFQSLIKSISDYYKVGIHPSYASNKDEKLLTQEIKSLQKITHKNTLKSRQHFLKLNLPITYRNLIRNDITADFTMGYSEKSGFRASICSPYYFYDLDTESETKLQIFPFAFMDATYQYYEKVETSLVESKLLELIEKVKKVKGTFISIWHNESLSEVGIWEGWTPIYEKMLKVSTNSD